MKNERYVLLLAILSLTIPLYRVIEEEYAGPLKRSYKVSDKSRKKIFDQLIDARRRRDRPEIQKATANIARVYWLNGDFESAVSTLDDFVEDEAQEGQEHILALEALADANRYRREDRWYRKARQDYNEAIVESTKLKDDSLSCRLSLKELCLLYLMGTNEMESPWSRLEALRDGRKVLADLTRLAARSNAQEYDTAIHNYSLLMDLEMKRLGSSS